MAKIIRSGTHLPVQMDDGRIRHARVTAVSDQDNIAVRLGTPKSSASVVFDADRIVSTTTRGTIFLED
jgi:hypothetical protein